MHVFFSFVWAKHSYFCCLNPNFVTHIMGQWHVSILKTTIASHSSILEQDLL